MNNLLTDRHHNASGLISFDDFSKANSIEDLAKLYASKGMTFPDQKSLLQQIARDFKASYLDALDNEIKNPAVTIEPTKITVGDLEVNLYGVVHKKFDHHPTFFDDLHQFILSQRGIIFAEHGISGMLFQSAPKDPNAPGYVIAIDDHIVGDTKSEMAFGILSKGNKLHNGVDRITPKTRPPQAKDNLLTLIGKLFKWIDDSNPKLTDLIGDKSGKQLCDEIVERFGLDIRDSSIIGQFDQIVQDNHAALFNTPGTLSPNLFFSANSSFLPECVDLDLKIQQKRTLSSIELRSAYIAEFIREWASSTSASQPCHIVCGAAHSAQIAYFLEHGSPESIKQLAASRVKKAKEDPKTYKIEYAVELLKTSINASFGAQLGEIFLEIGSIPGARWGVHRLLDIIGVPKAEQYRSNIETQ